MTNLDILNIRKSIRSYSPEIIPVEIKNKLRSEVTFINTHEAGLKFQLFFDDNTPFTKFFKSYGTFINPKNYLAAVVDTGVADIYEKAGYFAEKFVIEIIQLGLGTCFVGGTYDREAVNAQLRAGEKILFLVLFGFPLEKERFSEKLLLKIFKHNKKDIKDFFEPSSLYEDALREFPELETGLEAVSCAPSSLNKRPTRIFIREINGEKRLCAKVRDSNKKNLIDLGIAKYNFNFATDTICEWGNESPLIII